tara:strand:- start:8011 stop:8322 length:312 start_codon:yes stop_codon:yes gene_type:complete
VAFGRKIGAYLLAGLLLALAIVMFLRLDKRKALQLVGLAKGKAKEAELRTLRTQLAKQIKDDGKEAEVVKQKITQKEKELETIWSSADLPSDDIAARMRNLRV